MSKKPSASRKKKEKGVESEEAQTQGYKLIGARKLRELLATARSVYKDVREMAGGFGAEVKSAVENDNLHRKAFSAVRAADRMEPEKLAEFFAHRDFYEEALGLRKRAASAPRLPMAGDEEDGGEAGDGEGETGNVRPFPAQSSVAEA